MEFFRLENFDLPPTGRIHDRRTSGEQVERSETLKDGEITMIGKKRLLIFAGVFLFVGLAS